MGAVCCKGDIDFDSQVYLDHFYQLRAVGRGSFFKVRIVRHKRTGREYALKYTSKDRCIQRKCVGPILCERRLLERLEYPLIVNLRYAFQDDETIYMVLDLMLGGDLRHLLDTSGPLKELQVRFYVAQIALALHYLHLRRIAHRDIKPENILLDARGHAHVSDFNVAVGFSQQKPLRFTTAGTMAYMSPEMLGKQGYNYSVDWWSLGVTAYELLFGKRPFKGKTNDQMAESVLHTPLEFPANVYQIVSADCVNMISGLLEKSPNNRLGFKSFEKFKLHPWFAGLDWDALESKQAVPPYIPNDKTFHFDAVHEIEEMLLDDPQPRSRRLRTSQSDHPPVTEYAQWRQIVEDHFLPYDYTKQDMVFSPPPPPATSSYNYTVIKADDDDGFIYDRPHNKRMLSSSTSAA
ncbi:camp-dependent protein kinase [Lichtheimia corymbifera JMRC:FSU:9682]|uniref:non-specific serine/threonine protein kinase n=1 Tax=Lichtheimia corymbifera JMRC:FSU:9682 TaxID=1263082 RepID=A0A068RFE8_9FUNG|nr:camp-dependent protein kinase [Lichtheimia corymbifera JMRC:FSU:9682]